MHFPTRRKKATHKKVFCIIREELKLVIIKYIQMKTFPHRILQIDTKMEQLPPFLLLILCSTIVLVISFHNSKKWKSKKEEK